MPTPPTPDAGQPDKPERPEEPSLHIFVNRRKFDSGDGVKPRMSGAEIAALVAVPRDIAVVKLDHGGQLTEIGIDQVVEIRNGQHYLVTRKVVEGGCE